MKKALLFFIILTLFKLPVFSQEKIIDTFTIQGNKKLKTSFLKKLVKINAGTSLDSLLIEEDIISLKRLPSVAHAYYQVSYLSDNKYHVFYTVEENFTLIPNLNIYTSNDGEFAYKLGVNEFNFLGNNIDLGVFYQKDIYDSYGVYARAPNLFSRQFGLAIGHQNLTTQEPVFFTNSTANYKYNNTSFEVLGLYQLNFHNRIELGVNYFTENYQYKSGITSPNAPLNLRTEKRLLKFVFEYNNLNYQYQYLNGFRSLFNFQYIDSKDTSLSEFIIAWNDFFYFKRIGENGNFANRLRLGIATNEDSPFAPFSVDNNLNLRGVGNLIDRGTGVITLNTEYRHTIYSKNWFSIQTNTFLDIGSWRNPGGNLSDFGKSENIRIYPGLGVRFIHKKIANAVFRIDYGFGITKDDSNGFVFGIGQYF